MRRYTIILLSLLSAIPILATEWDWWPLPMAEADNQKDSIQYTLSLSAVSSSGTYAPFWLQTNQNGNISAAPHSGNLSAGIFKLPTRPNRWFDYDFGMVFTGRVQSDLPYPIDERINRRGTGYANLLYAHVRLYIIDLTAGIQPISLDETYPALGSGGLIFSNNAHPMPRVSIGIDRWTAFPGLFGYLEVRGGMSHMWQNDDVYITRGYVHHKFAGIRLGGKLPVNVSYELQHVAQWGGYSPIYGDLGNDLSSWWNACIAGAGGTMANDQLNAQGNHIGVQQLRLDAKGKEWKAAVYWQTIFEDASASFIGKGTNMADGLWGIEVSQSKWPFISGLCLEYLGTTDQSGPFHDRDGLIFAGNDNYYNNGIYQNGWNYFYRTIGTPFITSPIYNENGAIRTLNNRAKVWYVGLQGDIYGFQYKMLCSYARNYGTYSDDDVFSIQSTNTALLLQVDKHVEKAWGLDFGCRLAGDIGTQFGNSFGAMLTITKKGLIHTY